MQVTGGIRLKFL